MIVSMKYTFSFKVPEEYEEMKTFSKSLDKSEWRISSTSDLVTYTNEKTYFTNKKDDIN